MKELNIIFNEYHTIQASYTGEATDWKAAYERIKALYMRCGALRIKNCKNFFYYSFIKEELLCVLWDELKRLEKKAFNL